MITYSMRAKEIAGLEAPIENDEPSIRLVDGLKKL